MIKSLYIKNLAIIDELEVHFENGLNIVTGETGAGKSILVNAIAYLLGGRPCLADFAFMGPMYAHLYRDPYPSVIMKNVSPRVAEWVERMNQRNLYTGKIYDPDHGKLCNNDTW